MNLEGPDELAAGDLPEHVGEALVPVGSAHHGDRVDVRVHGGGGDGDGVPADRSQHVPCLGQLRDRTGDVPCGDVRAPPDTQAARA